MNNKTPQLKYHCPAHPDRAPFCAIGDYTPCRECYLNFRNQSRASVPACLIILFISILSWLSFAADPARQLTRHDPNTPCREIAPDYTSHPLYGTDCNELAFFVEKVTGRPWILEFTKHWLDDCHPYDDPLTSFDVSMDGKVNLEDFRILASCWIYYKTATGTKYHVRGCAYLKTSKIPVLSTRGLTPCSVCIIAHEWLSKD